MTIEIGPRLYDLLKAAMPYLFGIAAAVLGIVAMWLPQRHAKRDQ
jgi:hypothetical protein